MDIASSSSDLVKRMDSLQVGECKAPPTTDPRPPPGQRPRSRFCLVMIVRDEAPVIRRCLESLRNIVTSYLICDTGSVDCTPSIIEHFMMHAQIPGRVLHHPWKSFSVNKSWTLDRAREIEPDAEYWCWLDADEVYVTNGEDPMSYPSKADAEKLYQEMEAIRGVDVFEILTHYGGIIYPRWNLARNNQRYRWDIPVHELFIGETNNLTIGLNTICLVARKQGNSSRRDRGKEDIRNLDEWLLEHPGDVRATFYRGQCKMDDGDIDGAKVDYLMRCKLGGGYRQEIYVSWLRLGRLETDSTLKKVYFMNCIEMCPDRLEAYHGLMRMEGGFHYQYGALAPATRELKTREWLFPESCLYQYLFDFDFSVACWIQKRYSEAYYAGERALQAADKMPTHVLNQAKENMRFFKMHFTPPTSSISSANDSTGMVVQQQQSKPSTVAVPVLHPVCMLKPSGMTSSVLVIDNFLPNPDEVRAFALQQDFDVKGNFPGGRTRSFAKEAIGVQFKLAFERLLGKSITYWPDSYNVAYQITCAGDKSWIHRDSTDVGGVLYLTPNAPLDTGTSFFKHKSMGLEFATPGSSEEKLMNVDAKIDSAWETMDAVGNVYNRLVLFNGRRSHRSTAYFGNDKTTGRLFAAFFFNVETGAT